MNIIIQSGDKVPVTGYYKYDGHVDSGIFDCFVPKQSESILFKKGTTCMLLGSCEHKIKWELIYEYA